MERNRRDRCILMVLLLVALCTGSPCAITAQEETTFEEVLEAIRAERRVQEQPRLKRENPDQLKVFYDQYGECPFTKESITSMIDGLLVRSRLKPATSTEWFSDSTHFSLDVNLSCGDSDDNPPQLFKISTRFSEKATLQKPLGLLKVYMDHTPSYDVWGTYNRDREKSERFLRNAIRESVEDALTDYLKANFDL